MPAPNAAPNAAPTPDAAAPPPRSIATRLFRLSFQYYVVIAVALTGLLAVGEYLSARSALHKEMTTYQHAFAGGLGAALWSMDTGKLDAIATGMMEIPEITGIRVVDPANGHVFVTAVAQQSGIRVGRDGEVEAVYARLGGEAAIRHGFDVVFTHETGSAVLGRAEMLSGRDLLFDRIKGQTGLIVAISLFKEAVLWGIFLLVSGHVLVRPLRFLIDALNASRPDRPEPVTFPPAAARMVAGTELAVVRDAYNALIHRIEDQHLELLAANNRLEDLVAQRTRALEDANANLRDQARRLEATNAELEQFAYVASHDLRQPLRMVKSYMALLERGYADALDDDARTYIGFARDGADRMDRLINDLLSLSRVGHTARPFQAVSVTQVTADALAPLADDLAAASAAVTVADDLPAVMGDADELVRLVGNLVGNAVNYRDPARPPAITIGWRPAEGGQYVFSVSDNGIGIAPEHFDRIFQIFQRVGIPAGQQGTGIGLAICKKIVERHGGRIWVESVPGEGSTFLFTLPGVSGSAA